MRQTQYNKARHYVRELVSELKSLNKDLLPTEAELTERFKLGRNTIRKVIAELVSEGVVERIPGKGTFIIEKKKRINFLTWVGSEAHIIDDAINKMVLDFEEKSDKYAVHHQTFPFIKYFDSVLRLFTDCSPIDVLQTSQFWLPEFKKMNLLSPIDDIVAQDNIKRRYTSDIESCILDSRLYAINWTLCPFVLFYNNVVLEKAGLDPHNPPKTLDELKEMSMEINRSSDRNTSGIMVPLTPHEHNISYLYPFLLSFGGGLQDRMKNLTIDCDGNVNALYWLSDLYDRCSSVGARSISEARIMFATNHLGFWIDGPNLRGLLPQISNRGEEFNQDYGVTKIPVGPSGRSESTLLAHSLAVTKRCRELELAKKWIEHLTTDRQNAVLYYERSGMIPCIRDILDDPYFLSDAFASVVVDQLNTATLLPIDHSLFIRSLPIISYVFSKIILDRQKPEEELKNLRNIINMLSEIYSFSYTIHL
jgi:multiple sugar transport system substrate-binding protein